MTEIHTGDVRDVLPTLDAGSVQCVVTSPPYWGLRDYGVEGQIGLEPTPDAYIATVVAVFREVRRVLRDDGTCWLNLGDSYAGGTQTGRNDRGRSREGGGSGSGREDGSDRTRIEKRDGLKPKDLCMIPARVALALQADGWYLRSDIIWAKGLSFCPSYAGTVMPESVTDRPTQSHEHVFLLTKSPRYYYDADAVREQGTTGQGASWATRKAAGATGGSFNTGNNQQHGQGVSHDLGQGGTRNLRSVWTINPQPYREAHFATFPTALVEPCIKAGSKTGDTVLDPFAGSGTVGCVALKLGRTFVGIELNPDYSRLARESILGPLFV